MKKLRTAVIGAGNMGKNHARVYSEISDLVAIADISAERGQPIASRYGVKFYNDFKQMIKESTPEAISIVVPTKFHKEVAIYCLKKGVPVLVEKPIADTTINAKRIIEESKKNSTLLMVGHVERFNPALSELKRLVTSNKLGKIVNLFSMRVGVTPVLGPDSDVSLDLAIHDVDIFNYLLEELPVEKRIIKHKIFKDNVADSASIVLRYKEASGVIQTNWLTPIKKRFLYVTGTDGFAELNYIEQKLTLYDKLVTKKPIGDFFEFVSLSNQTKKDVYISKKEPLKQELLFFLKEIRNDTKQSERLARYALSALEILTKK
jgi:UDP-N-acetylglucosamine 3-dehydrogenase